VCVRVCAKISKVQQTLYNWLDQKYSTSKHVKLKYSTSKHVKLAKDFNSM